MNLPVDSFWNKKAGIISSLFEFGALAFFIYYSLLIQNLTVGGTANQQFYKNTDLQYHLVSGFDTKESNGWKKAKSQNSNGLKIMSTIYFQKKIYS